MTTRFLNILLFSILPLQAQMPDYSIERVSMEGITQNSITSICQDHQGFLWFATYDGLNRYDGYTFKTFQNDPLDSLSLSDNNVKYLYEDSQNNLWIGTGGGLNKFNRDSENFEHIRAFNEETFILTHHDIRAIHEDRFGNLWIGSWGGGLGRYDYGLNRIISDYSDETNPHSLSDNRIAAISEDSHGILWIATANGVSAFDPVKEQFTVYRHQEKSKNSISLNDISMIYADHYDHIWIGTWGGGLNRLDPEKNQFKRYISDPGDDHMMNSSIIRSISEDQAGQLWIGTWGGGLLFYHPETDSFSRITSDAVNPETISGNYIYTIYPDRNDILWIGTDLMGITKIDLKKKKFPNDQTASIKPLNSTIYCINEEDGILWIGTKGEGLIQYDRKLNRVQQYLYDSNDPNSISNNVVRAVIHDKTGNLWIATEIGLNRFEPESGKFHRFMPDPDNPDAISYHNVFSLSADHSGNIWIGTMTGGLDKLNPSTLRFNHYQTNPDDSGSISDNFIWSIFEDHQKNLWIATDVGGLNRFNEDTDTFIHYRYNSKDTTSLSDDKVLIIYEDRKFRLWFGTTKGLNLYNDSTNSFTRYTVEDGLTDNSIHGILEDDHGNLWLTTNNGLSKFNPDENTVTNYSQKDGLKSQEFSVNAAYTLNSGEMIIGGTHGLNIFHPDSIKLDPLVPEIVITDFQLFNKSIPIQRGSILEHSITQTKEIKLSYNADVISLEFAALYYRSPEKNQYAYKLENFEKDFNYVQNRRFATYTNLPAGQYKFTVIASNSDGIWNRTGTSLKITIMPPFWETWWFRLSGILLITVIILSGYRWRIHRIQTYQKELEEQVEIQTKNLRNANQKLKSQKRSIQQNALKLKQANKELEDQKNKLRIYILALERSNEELEQFAHVASHDLQEPLRMISSYSSLLERRLKGKLEEDTREFFDFMIDGSRRMQILINDLLMYSRLSTQTGPMIEVDFNQPMSKVLQNIHIMIHENDATITYGNLPTVCCDPVQIERLLQNLLINAMKYCTDKPVIHISASETDSDWQIGIHDNGIGIDSKYHQKIFGIFQRLHARESYSGTGIGLAVCKKIIDQHEGRLWVESGGEGTGSVFNFTLHKKNHHSFSLKQHDTSPLE